MNRQKIIGEIKKNSGLIKRKAGQLVGSRHVTNPGAAEKTESGVQSDAENAMDAVRDVVNNEK